MKDLQSSVLQLIGEHPDKLTRKDIARRLDIKGDDRRALRDILRELLEGGQLILSKRKTFRPINSLPGVMVLRVDHIDEHGDLIGVPEKWSQEDSKASAPPKMIIRQGPTAQKSGSKKGKARDELASLRPGARLLARIKPVAGEEGLYKAQLMKKLGAGPQVFMGVLTKDGRGWIIKPVDKKARHEYRPTFVPPQVSGDSLVQYRTGGRRGAYEVRAEIDKILGPADDPKLASLISLETHNIPTGFPDDALTEAQALKLPTLDISKPDKYRQDLRHIPLITIDPVDAKDFDDAIYASPDEGADNIGGWVVWVAIADVAAFVRSGGALDIAAREKGNSVYLPDRVEPMLPEILSADLCSLRPNEDRACMAVEMRFDKEGVKIGHKFVRGLMRSRARLTYAQAQEGFDGNPGAAALPVMDILEQIHSAYKTLRRGRERRAPLDIDLPERRIRVDENGDVASITIRARFDAHKLIEEFMVMANVAAAEALADKGVITIIRIHEPPAAEKLQSLHDFAPAVGLSWAAGERPTTERFNRLLAQAKKIDLGETVSMAVLRTQSQAFYGLEIKGHFGLNLSHYAHFTSPIRRYADLVVHRALIKTFNLGVDGTVDSAETRLKDTAEHISNTERRAMAAERDAKDRYIAKYLEEQIGSQFEARITGVAKAGLFVMLDETGADGFIPARTLGDAYFMFDEKSKSLINVDTGATYHFGRKVKVRLREAAPITGGMIFEMLTPPEKGAVPKRNHHSSRQKYRAGAKSRSKSGKGKGKGKTKSKKIS